MSDAILDPQEMEAIQAAIRESAPRRSAAPPDLEPTRLALIADDRIAESARPVLMGLATRASRIAARALRSHLPGTWQLDVVGAEILDGTTVKDELRNGWVAGLAFDRSGPRPSGRGPETPDDRDGELVIATHGGVIDLAAARRCGAAAPTSDGGRPPSAVSLRLFQPTGRALLDCWRQAWREVFPGELAASSDLAIVARILEAKTIVRVALAFAGAASGRIQVYARPEVLVPRPAALAAFKANAQRIANALSHVSVEVVAELGTLQLKLRELRALEKGRTFTPQGFVDSRVPVFVGGVLKAWARPVVCRGVLAVQIESVVHGQGTRS